MDETKGKFQYAGLKFLYDMELIDDPQLINNMKLNLFDVSGSIRDVDFLSSYHHKQMLIWLNLGWFGKTFLKDRIEAAALDRVKQMLPRFRFRVTSDREIFEMALKRIRNVMKGEEHEEPNSKRASSDGSSSSLSG